VLVRHQRHLQFLVQQLPAKDPWSDGGAAPAAGKMMIMKTTVIVPEFKSSHSSEGADCVMVGLVEVR
jgi:hypothetical protein